MARRRFDSLLRFVEELRRRHVVRVGFAYLVVAFAILQGADLVLPELNVPDWTFRALVFATLAGFPLTLVLAWVYDITPDGVKKTGASWLTGAAAADDAIDSVAILPFTYGGDDDGYLADGITESIINKMASLPGVRVVPRASAFRYRGREIDPREVRRSLQVRALVTGRVQQRGDVLVAQAELVDLDSEEQLWGERYTRAAADIFDVQEQMADEIARSLRLRLTGQERARLMHRETDDPDAYRAYLKGRHYWNRRTADGFRHAIVHFQEAIARDPEYALAHAGLADTYNVIGYYNIEDPRDAYPKAKAAARRVLELDELVAEAHASLGYATLFFDRDYEGAAAELRRAIELEPGYATAHQWYGWYLLVRERFDEMVASLERAVELDPLSLIINDHYGYALFLAGRYDDARRQIGRTLELDPNYPLAHLRLGNLHVHQGRDDEAVDCLRRAGELSAGLLGRGYLGQALATTGRVAEAREILAELVAEEDVRYVSPLDRALVLAGLGELERTLAALEEAMEHRTSDLVRLRLLPWPREVREHPGFDAILGRLGLVTA